MQAKKVLSVILVLIVIVYAVSGLKNLSKNKQTTTETGNGQVTSTVDYSKLTNQLVYNGQNIDIKIIDVNGSYYLPLVELGNKLNYKIGISEDGKVNITDGKNNTVIKSDVTVFINGEEHNKAQNFQPVNNYIVPLDFVRVVFGVEFDYSIDEEKNIKYFYMTGRDIYEIGQADAKSPHLYVYTNTGKRDLGVISDKAYLEAESANYPTTISSVIRTENSDIITTNYTAPGALTSEHPNVLYVKNGSLIENANLSTNSYVAGETLGVAPTQTYDDKVAFLSKDDEGNTTIRVYDDKTGNLVSEIDTMNKYGAQVYNIQAVANDFLVVGMYKPLYEDSYNTYYTAVINLNTNEVIPVYEKFGQAETIKSFGMEDNAVNYINTNTVPFDGIIFNFIADDGSLKFTANNYGMYTNITPETVNITLSK